MAKPESVTITCESKNGAPLIGETTIYLAHVEAMIHQGTKSIVDMSSGNWYVAPASVVPVLVKALKEYHESLQRPA